MNCQYCGTNNKNRIDCLTCGAPQIISYADAVREMERENPPILFIPSWKDMEEYSKTSDYVKALEYLMS